MFLKTVNQIDEETELECTWPEKPTGRKVLLSCSNFKLNLNFPIISTANSTKSNLQSLNRKSLASQNSINVILIFDQIKKNL